MAMLELRGVTKRFDGSTALDAIDLEVGAGETLVLIGSSGCGKSTALRLAVGLIAPDAGEVRVDGQTVDASSAALLRRRIGYVIQEGGLFPHLVAGDNAMLMARHLGWEPEAIERRLQELCELCKLPRELLARYPVQLSGGQRQRVSLMRALALDPDLLLLDEPLGALDPIIRAGLQDELRELFASLRKTVLLVTHDVHEAAHLGDRLALMRDGRILQTGTPTDLLHTPADPFVARFIGAQRRGFAEPEPS